MLKTLSLAALVAALAVSTARAQAPVAPIRAQAPAAGAAVSDPLFATAAAISGIAEVSLSELGLQKATDPQLKSFSQQMVAEHTRMNNELAGLAAQKRLPVPTDVDPRAKFCAQSLAGLSGQEFDRCYAKAQLTAHMDAVGMFEAEAQRGQDPDMRALAAKALPHIKEHLRMIEPIAMKYKERSDSTTTSRDATNRTEK